MAMELIEFRRKLEQSDIDRRIKFFLIDVAERQVALSNDLDKAMRVLLELANTVAAFTQLHEATQGHIKELMRRGIIDGVDVRSESIEDDPERHN